MLLVGFVSLLQVMFFALLEDFYPGRLAVKDWDKTHRITGVILIMWYQSQVDHGECLIYALFFIGQFSDQIGWQLLFIGSFRSTSCLCWSFFTAISVSRSLVLCSSRSGIQDPIGRRKTNEKKEQCPEDLIEGIDRSILARALDHRRVYAPAWAGPTSQIDAPRRSLLGGVWGITWTFMAV
jgi:hypothetical protein